MNEWIKKENKITKKSEIKTETDETSESIRRQEQSEVD